MTLMELKEPVRNRKAWTALIHKVTNTAEWIEEEISSFVSSKTKGPIVPKNKNTTPKVKH